MRDQEKQVGLGNIKLDHADSIRLGAIALELYLQNRISSKSKRKTATYLLTETIRNYKF